MLPTRDARLGNLDQPCCSCAANPIDGVDEVGDQVGAPLILVEDLGPGRLDLFVASLDVVVAATANPAVIRTMTAASSLRMSSSLKSCP